MLTGRDRDDVMKRFALCAAVASIAVTSSAEATSVVALNADGLVRESQAIGVAQVLRTQVVSGPSGVVTLAELQFYRALKGVKRHDTMLVQVPGGELIPGRETRVDGAPKLKAGQMFLGFFHEHGGVMKPTALSYGVMPVVSNADGVFRVLQRHGGLRFVEPDGRVSSEGPIRVHNRPLDEVLTLFQGVIDAQRPPLEPGVQP